jgi:hypothetical protein
MIHETCLKLFDMLFIIISLYPLHQEAGTTKNNCVFSNRKYIALGVTTILDEIDYAKVLFAFTWRGWKA